MIGVEYKILNPIGILSLSFTFGLSVLGGGIGNNESEDGVTQENKTEKQHRANAVVNTVVAQQGNKVCYKEEKEKHTNDEESKV